MISGTPDYVAPEVSSTLFIFNSILNKKKIIFLLSKVLKAQGYGVEVDIWSTGVLT